MADLFVCLNFNGQQLTLQQIVDVANGREQVVLAAEARARAEQARQVVQEIVTQKTHGLRSQHRFWQVVRREYRRSLTCFSCN